MHNEIWTSYHIQTFIFLSLYRGVKKKHWWWKISSVLAANESCGKLGISRWPVKWWFGQCLHWLDWPEKGFFVPSSFVLVYSVSTDYINIALLSLIHWDNHRPSFATYIQLLTWGSFPKVASLIRLSCLLLQERAYLLWGWWPRETIPNKHSLSPY